MNRKKNASTVLVYGVLIFITLISVSYTHLTLPTNSLV